jgi:hypothetical protein
MLSLLDSIKTTGDEKRAGESLEIFHEELFLKINF